MAMPTTAKPMSSASNGGSVACRGGRRNGSAHPVCGHRAPGTCGPADLRALAWLRAAAELVRAVRAREVARVAHQRLERLDVVRVVDAADLEVAVDEREVAAVRDRRRARRGDALLEHRVHE